MTAPKKPRSEVADLAKEIFVSRVVNMTEFLEPEENEKIFSTLAMFAFDAAEMFFLESKVRTSVGLEEEPDLVKK